jgi:hypothetical protein
MRLVANEADYGSVLLALIRHGPLTTSEIPEKIDLDQPLVYQILVDLHLDYMVAAEGEIGHKTQRWCITQKGNEYVDKFLKNLVMQKTSSSSVGSNLSDDGTASATHRMETVSTGQESSVEITQTAKGSRVAVKVYHADPRQAGIDAVNLYEQTIRQLKERNL